MKDLEISIPREEFRPKNIPKSNVLVPPIAVEEVVCDRPSKKVRTQMHAKVKSGHKP